MNLRLCSRNVTTYSQREEMHFRRSVDRIAKQAIQWTLQVFGRAPPLSTVALAEIYLQKEISTAGFKHNWNETDVATRAVRIELFKVRVLYRASYRVLEYSTDTGSSSIGWSEINGHLVPYSCFSNLQQRFKWSKTEIFQNPYQARL